MTPESIQHELEDLTSGQPDKPKDGDSGEFTIQALWRTLSEREDIIIVIDKVDEPSLRKQLSSMKAKENYKLKSAGIPTDDVTLEFITHKDISVDEDQVKLQVILKHKPRIKLHKFILPKE